MGTDISRKLIAILKKFSIYGMNRDIGLNFVKPNAGYNVYTCRPVPQQGEGKIWPDRRQVPAK